MTSPLQQKIRVTGPVLITANRLSDGAVILRTAAGDWTTDLDEAEILRTADSAAVALKSAQGDGLVAVGPYIAPVDADEPSRGPGNLREMIRMSGPTISLPQDKPRRAVSSVSHDREYFTQLGTL